MKTNPSPLPIEPLLLRAEQAAALCGLATSTVYQLISSGQFCPSIKLGKARLWRTDLLRQWTEQNCPPIDKFEILRKETKK
jgi:excisionase family DNA binding protein